MGAESVEPTLDKSSLGNHGQENSIDSPPTTDGSQQGAQETEKQDLAVEYPNTIRQVLIIIALMLGMFLAGLDISIIATAIPAITSEFNSLSQEGWYGSAFFLCYGAFQSVWGKAYKFFDMKYVFICALFWFEVGCLICALAPNSAALIVGRAVQGGGAAGLLLGCYTIPNFIVPPNRVPAVVGLIGTVFSIASIIGPLLGGVFTSNITWRWCFYVNLPIGAVPFFFTLLFFKTPAHAKASYNTPLPEVIKSFDLLGLLLYLSALICYFLALSWGGVIFAWNDSKVIGTLVGWVLLTILFFANEIWMGERALFVLRLLKNRDLLAGCLYLFFIYGAFFSFVYNLPVYFQATAGLSPQDSGIQTIPIICACSIVTFVASPLMAKYGYYLPYFVVGAAITAVSGGLTYTFDIETTLALCSKSPPIIAGVVTSNADKAVGLSVVLITQFYTASLVLAASSAITNNLLVKNIPIYAPAVNPEDVFSVGAFDLQSHFSGVDLYGIRQAYIVGLRGAWAMGIALFGVAFLTVFVVKWPGKMVSHSDVATNQEGAKTNESGEKVIESAA
ncbi:major facilitator superfamily transporter [Seiridium cupressi]